MSRGVVRVGVVNDAPRVGQIQANVERAAHWCRQGAAAGVDLVVFPEAWTTGYDEATFAGVLPERNETSVWATLQDAVDHTGVVVVINAAVRERQQAATLTSYVLRPAQAAVAAYDKQHLFGAERDHFTAGDGGADFELNGFAIALSVCYDVEFPEHAEAATRAGADVYLNSGLYFCGSEERRDVGLAARALDNGLYVVFAGVAGEHAGGSCVIDPMGRTLARLDREVGLVVAEIN